MLHFFISPCIWQQYLKVNYELIISSFSVTNKCPIGYKNLDYTVFNFLSAFSSLLQPYWNWNSKNEQTLSIAHVRLTQKDDNLLQLEACESYMFKTRNEKRDECNSTFALGLVFIPINCSVRKLVNATTARIKPRNRKRPLWFAMSFGYKHFTSTHSDVLELGQWLMCQVVVVFCYTFCMNSISPRRYQMKHLRRLVQLWTQLVLTPFDVIVCGGWFVLVGFGSVGQWMLLMFMTTLLRVIQNTKTKTTTRETSFVASVSGK